MSGSQLTDPNLGRSRHHEEAGIHSDARYLSSTVIVDVNNGTRVPLVVFNFFVILLSITAFWASIALVLHRNGLAAHARNHTIPKSILIKIVERPEVPAFLLYGFLFVTAAVGFLGGLRENVCLLTTHAVLVGALACVALIFSCLAFVLPASARNYVKHQVSVQLIESYRESEGLQAMIDWIQINYKCCGISEDTYRDWSLNPYFQCDRDNLSRERCGVPASCCRRNDSKADEPVMNVQCGAKVLQISEQEAWKKIYTRSCADAVFSQAQHLTVPLAAVFIVVCLLALLWLTLTLAVRRDIVTLSVIYGVYYKHAIEGHDKMAQVEG
ncbi:unnamed protein product, partial [Ixodes pacificus]